MLGCVSGDIKVKDEVVFILLCGLGELSCELVCDFDFAIATNQVKFQGHTLLILCFLEKHGVLFKNPICSLFTLDSVSCPLASHQTNQT